jgi:alpha-beta hydrolase superfamily lysophospholipase
MVQTSETPTLLFAGVYDDIVPPERVHELYEYLGAKSKVLVDLACSSHKALWERNRLLMFEASLEWLQSGTVDGKSSGILQTGD